MKTKFLFFIAFLSLALAWTACNNSTAKVEHPASCYAPPEALAAPVSEPVLWVRVNEKAELFVLGNQVTDTDILKSTLKAALAKLKQVPATIPPVFEGEVGMGTRQEVETLISEAVFEVRDGQPIMDIIHGFYQKHLTGTLGIPPVESFTPAPEKGKHLQLDLAKLDTWIAALKNTGYVSDEYLNQLKPYFQKCEGIWKSEDEGPYSCLEGDLFTCMQDSPEMMIDHYTKVPLALTPVGEDRVVARISQDEWEENMELKRENGKWLLTKFGCDLTE